MEYRKHYDQDQAAKYRQAKEFSNRGTHAAEVRLAARGLEGVDRSESIVDVPCGAGRMTVVLVGMGFRPAAADVSPAMVEFARERFKQEKLDIPVEIQDLEKTTWPDQSFDNVFSFRFFHHLPTDAMRKATAKEMCRIAKKRVIVSYLDARSWTARRRAVESALRGKRTGKHVQRPSEIKAYFKDAGFEIVADHARMPFIHSLRLLVARRPA